MKFSICIPNYNYARYLGETIASALEQTHESLEVHVIDNASTDDSIAVLQSIDDPRLSFDRNRTNVGFAPNLDRAVTGTTGDWIILLSSDDLMKPDALDTYRRVIDQVGGPAARVVISGTCEILNGTGEPVGLLRPPDWCWRPEDVDVALTAAIGCKVYRLAPAEVLRRSLSRMRNPLWFASTAYPRELYDQVEGYRGQGLINPDKEFHWRLIGAADSVFFVDEPLFCYRVHSSNQHSQETQSGALKRLVDQYVLSFNADDSVCDRAGVSKDELAQCFIREDVAKRAILSLIEGDGGWARRNIAFGTAAYPRLMRSDPLAVLARALVAFRPLTVPILGIFASSIRRRLIAQRTLLQDARADG